LSNILGCEGTDKSQGKETFQNLSIFKYYSKFKFLTKRFKKFQQG
jgi:hypothetical protein